jgi:PhzF family phenazine biosynthesis protein
MSTLHFSIIDVFTSTPYKGNPLAVVDNTNIQNPLTTTQMKLIARQFNLSETTFISPPTSATTDTASLATWRLRSFLPNGEEVFGAGHNSLGAWWWIAYSGLVDTNPDGNAKGNGMIYHQQLGNTILPVRISQFPPGDGEIMISMHQGIPQFLDTYPDPESLSRSLGIERSDLRLNYAGVDLVDSRVVTTSPARHLLVPVRNGDVLRRVSFADKVGIEAVLASTDSCNSGVYVFTSVDVDVDSEGEQESAIPRFEARFFSPGMGKEDPATGSAAGPLAAYLWNNNAVGFGDRVARIEVLQGIQAGRRCLMNVCIEAVGDVASVSISGTGILVAEGDIIVPRPGLAFQE